MLRAAVAAGHVGPGVSEQPVVTATGRKPLVLSLILQVYFGIQLHAKHGRAWRVGNRLSSSNWTKLHHAIVCLAAV